MTNKVGVLLTNIGTPDAPTPSAVRRYLKTFLSDRRVVELPRFIWLPILYGIILPFRAIKSAKLYREVWTENGSPLLFHSQKIADELQNELKLPVALGMHYSNPSIQHALDELRSKQVDKIIILPLFPQYSATTTASSFDAVAAVLKTWRNIPAISFIHDYAADENYINCLSESIQNARETQGKPDHLLFSFHGIPKRCIKLGDPYAERCHATAQLVAEKLQLEKDTWSVSFQSRLGRAEWLKPYTDKVLESLSQQGIKNIHVICPGFPADCLETLEEIAIRGKEQFLTHGGTFFHYIPALNSQKNHIDTLKKLITNLTS